MTFILFYIYFNKTQVLLIARYQVHPLRILLCHFIGSISFLFFTILPSSSPLKYSVFQSQITLQFFYKHFLHFQTFFVLFFIIQIRYRHVDIVSRPQSRVCMIGRWLKAGLLLLLRDLTALRRMQNTIHKAYTEESSR